MNNCETCKNFDIESVYGVCNKLGIVQNDIVENCAHYEPEKETQENYCDGLDCAYCLDVNCPKTAIMVDGVNVRYCQYYRFEKCSRLGTPCTSDTHCYYKQWQREIQKNNTLIKISDTKQETIINLARRKKELEQILAEMKNILVRF